MKIVRAFMRNDESNFDIDHWSIRMDSLLCADERDLVEFICDGILALSVKSGKGPDDVVDFFHETNGVQHADSVMEMVQNRWKGIISVLGEHMPEREAKERLARMSKEAPWE